MRSTYDFYRYTPTITQIQMSKADAPEPATMVAVRGRETDSCEIAAPLGLDVYLGGYQAIGNEVCTKPE